MLVSFEPIVSFLAGLFDLIQKLRKSKKAKSKTFWAQKVSGPIKSQTQNVSRPIKWQIQKVSGSIKWQTQKVSGTIKWQL